MIYLHFARSVRSLAFFQVGTLISHANHNAPLLRTFIHRQFQQHTHSMPFIGMENNHKRGQGGTAVKTITFIEGRTYVCKSRRCMGIQSNGVPSKLLIKPSHIVPFKNN